MSYEEEVLLDDGYNSEEKLPQAHSANTSTAPSGSEAVSDDSDEGGPLQISLPHDCASRPRQGRVVT